MGLVDADVTLSGTQSCQSTVLLQQERGKTPKTHLGALVMEVLLRVYAGLERGGPAGGINRSPLVRRAGLADPIDEKGDGVLRLRHAVVRRRGGDARRGGSDHPTP